MQRQSGPGGWGVVLEEGEETEQASGSAPATTNNRMGSSGAGGLLSARPQPCSGIHYFRLRLSRVTKWIQGWRRRRWLKRDGKPVANADLWQALDQLMDQYAIHWINAKGQQLAGLEEAGKLAVNAVQVA
ncbi:MAG: ribonuclease HI [Chloroflexi bacterium]|nr:ribonuclease HI [Chloroflexota bacterium]